MASAFLGRFGRVTQHKYTSEFTRAYSSSAIACTTTRGAATANFARETVEAEENPHALRTELSSLCINGLLKEALGVLNIMDRQNIPVDPQVYVSLLEACANRKALKEGKRVHNHMLATGFDHNVALCTKLVSMYVMCGSLENARLVFEKAENPNIYLWNGIIIGYARFGFHEEVLRLYCRMQKTFTEPDKYTFPSVLKACASLSALQQGKCAHDLIIKNGLESDVVVASALLGMYAKLGKMDDARHLFDKMPQRDVVSWNVLLAVYAQLGNDDEALKLFNRMQVACPKPSAGSLTTIISACAHDGMGNGFSELVCKMHMSGIKTNVVTWNTMIAGTTQRGDDEEALKLFHQMNLVGIEPNSVTVASVLPACAHLASLQEGKEIHGYIIRRGFQLDLYVGNTLMDMYAKCGLMVYAHSVFNKMSNRDVVSWTTMIVGYAQNGDNEEATKLFRHMQVAGIKPNVVTWNGIISFSAQNGHSDEALKLFREMRLTDVKPSSVTIASILSVCSHLAALEQGKMIHDYIIRRGFQADVLAENALIDMYAKCGCLEDARRVFDKMPQKDVVSWNTLIVGYAQNGKGDEALNLFHEMQVTGVDPNVFSWTAMISTHAQNGLGDEALKLFREMQVVATRPNSVTIASVLPACSYLVALQPGKEIHGYMIRNGFELGVNAGNALIDMYAKCGNIEDACLVFNKLSGKDEVSWNAIIAGYAQKGLREEAWNLFCQMQLAGIKPSVISWTSMIAGYAQNGNCNESLKLFSQMQETGLKPDSVTLASVLPACAHLAALKQGKEIHDRMIRSGFDLDVFAGTALIDMYAKCGSIQDARHVFDRMPGRNVVSWNAIIVGYAMHGHGADVLSLFSKMQGTGRKPDHITFTGVLSACSHSGLVDEGQKYFYSMSQRFGIIPRLEHYACMTDLFGRAGLFDEAQKFISNMPSAPNASVWGALLGACRIHCNIELAGFVAEQLLELEPHNVGTFVLLSNIYAAAGRWDEVAKVRKMMKDKGLKKNPGWSWIEVMNRVHVFHVGDRSHPQTQKIYETLENLSRQMKLEGYTPNTNFALRDVEEEEKENILSVHSEKLAIAFGIINTCPQTPIRIIKNLRVCGDCHTATKFISKIVGQEIIVRDANRFHHFKNGICSCGDYW